MSQLKIIYHVFSNNQDEWYDALPEAEKAYQTLKDDSNCARLYEEIHNRNEVIEENCLSAYGEWPL